MYQGRSLRSIAGSAHAEGWDEVYASHTFHEVTMYYPMRMVRTRTHKLIWNIAYPLEFPFASDLYESKTWQGVLQRGDTQYGVRTVDALLHRTQFELYDLVHDPNETVNLAGDPAHADLLSALKEKLRTFQKRTKDPWILKWDRE
jgi:N-sulfoglucosamine sulfohydrolase